MRIPCIEMFFPNINDAFESNMNPKYFSKLDAHFENIEKKKTKKKKKIKAKDTTIDLIEDNKKKLHLFFNSIDDAIKGVIKYQQNITHGHINPISFEKFTDIRTCVDNIEKEEKMKLEEIVCRMKQAEVASMSENRRNDINKYEASRIRKICLLNNCVDYSNLEQ